MLKNQIEGAGLKAVSDDEVVTLETAETRLREALTRLMEGDEAANADLEKVHPTSCALLALALPSRAIPRPYPSPLVHYPMWP